MLTAFAKRSVWLVSVPCGNCLTQRGKFSENFLGETCGSSFSTGEKPIHEETDWGWCENSAR